MLIVLPPSETKRRSPDEGPAVDLAGLSFPELTPLRERVAAALIETSAAPDAFRRLGVRPTLAGDVAANTRLLELPTLPAVELYTGPLHLGLDLANAPATLRGRAVSRVVITSAVWGVLRPDDAVPTYRCSLFAHLVGIDRLDHAWRPLAAEVLTAAAGDGAVIDLRAAPFQQLGRPASSDRVVTVRVEQRVPGKRIGDVVAKRVRGEAARFLLESGSDPEHPVEVAELLGDRWPVQLDAPARPGRPWTLSMSVVD